MIHCGDLFDVLPTLDAESIDACVTDPPYGIGFMGREWDTFKPGVEQKRVVVNRAIGSANPNVKGRSRGPASSPSAVEYDRSVKGQHEFETWTERWAREVYRVLKPGAHLLVCGAPRSFHRMTCGIEDAGFQVRDCLSWLTGQGFPKSLNIGEGRGTALKPAWEPIMLARKPTVGTVAANVQKHGTGALNIDACRIGETDTRRIKEGGRGQFPHEDDAWTPKTVTVGSDLGRWPSNVALDEAAAAMLDEQTGELVSGANPTRRWSDKFRGIYSEFPWQVDCVQARGAERGGASRFFLVVDQDDSSTHNNACEKQHGVTSESQMAAGIENGENLEAGKSISSLSIDGCGSKPTDQSKQATKSTTATTTNQTIGSITSSSSQPNGTTTTIRDSEKTIALLTASSSGVVSDAESIDPSQTSRSDRQEPIRATVENASQQPSLSGEKETESTTTPTCGRIAHGGLDEICLTGKSPGLRFFYCPKPSRAERDLGCDHLTAQPRDESRKAGNPGGDNPRNRGLQPRGNFHPTVKPIDLMRWLVRLVTPLDGTVLDPFMGSGTTGIACRLEGREFIGIEREAEYVAIAEARIAAVLPLFNSEATA